MARPFDDSLPYQQLGSSMSSQTSLAGGRVWRSQTESATNSSSPYVDSGSSWNSPRLENLTSKKASRPKLPKIKSSPSHGALAAARASHAKFHRRGTSIASSAQSPTSPTSPTFVPDFLLKTASPIVPASAHADPYAAPESRSGTKSKVKIKPLLRKFSSQEKVSGKVDLSRSAAENEGLGIYTSSEVDGSQFGLDARRGFHNRTVSGTSQVSTTTTASNRYGTQYVHPMRQTPRPYTPPVPSSYKTSLESEAPTVTSAGDLPYFEAHSRTASSNTTNTPTSYAPIPSSRKPPPLHIRTGSASRLTSSSQTNLPGTPSSLRFNTDTITSADMVSPTARSSFESKIFTKRSRSNTANTATDPISQQATVQALRQKFQEKEAAKDRKYQEAEARAQEKEARRQEKREENERRTSEKRERKRTKSNAASEKSSFMIPGDQNESSPVVHLYPPEVPTLAAPPNRRRGDTAGSAGKAVHSQWSLFWFRFKTMWLKLKRKMTR